jgi:hypothetical protein
MIMSGLCVCKKLLSFDQDPTFVICLYHYLFILPPTSLTICVSSFVIKYVMILDTNYKYNKVWRIQVNMKYMITFYFY